MRISQAEKVYHKTVLEISIQVAERKRKRGLKNTLYTYQPPKTVVKSLLLVPLIRAGFTYKEAVEYLYK